MTLGEGKMLDLVVFPMRHALVLCGGVHLPEIWAYFVPAYPWGPFGLLWRPNLAAQILPECQKMDLLCPKILQNFVELFGGVHVPEIWAYFQPAYPWGPFGPL